MTSPQWLAAAAGSTYRAQAGQVNQFLVGHTSSWLYAGTLQASQTTGTGVYSSTQGTYLAQPFATTANQTTIGQVWLQVSTVGGSPITATITPLTLTLYLDGGGTPTGSALASTTVNEQYVYSSGFWLQFPLGVTGLIGSTTYQLVLSPAGTGTAYYVWQHSNQVSGASTSTDGVTWTPQTYGLMYQVYDASTGGNVQFIWDDAGARWTRFSYDSLGRYSMISEYVIAQSGNAFQSSRTLSYTNLTLTGVS